MTAAVALAAALMAQQPGAARPGPAPLLRVAERLEAATGARDAAAALAELDRAFSGVLGLPDERMHKAAPPALHAATADAVLAAVIGAAERFPELREQAAGLLAGWDACALREGQWDLVGRPFGIERSPAAPFEPRGLPAAGLSAGGAPAPLFVALSAAGREAAHARCWPMLTPEQFAALEKQEREEKALGPPILPLIPPPPRYATVPAAQPKTVPVPGAGPVGGSIAPPASAAWSTGRFHLGTAAYVSWLLEGRYQVGVGALWNPVSHLFARAGLGYRVGKDRAAYFSWGFGYDDWHPNTFSLQINDFGPTRFDGTGWRQAVVDLGYKLFVPCKGEFCFSTYASVDVPLQGTVFGGVRETVTWQDLWFLRFGVNVTGHGDLQWVYGLGRYDWRPLGVSVSYDNWGPNTIPSTGFRSHGSLTVAVNGAF